MEVQTVTINNTKPIPSGTAREDIRVRHSGIAKVLWRKLDREVPPSTVLTGGVN